MKTIGVRFAAIQLHLPQRVPYDQLKTRVQGIAQQVGIPVMLNHVQKQVKIVQTAYEASGDENRSLSGESGWTLQSTAYTRVSSPFVSYYSHEKRQLDEAVYHFLRQELVKNHPDPQNNPFRALPEMLPAQPFKLEDKQQGGVYFEYTHQ